MDYILRISFLIFFSYNSYSLSGFGDWVLKAPGNTEMNNYSCDGIEFYTMDKKRSCFNLQRWYFYKNHIIAKIKNKDHHVIGYLVLDEKKSKFYIFQDENRWEKFLNQHHLIPIFWTRWYTDEWLFFDDFFWLKLILFFPITGLILFLIIFSFIKIFKKNTKNKKYYFFVIFGIGIFIICFYLLDLNPNSF